MQGGLVRSASGWVDLAVSSSSKFERKRALAYWLMANKMWMPGPRVQCKRGVKSYFDSPAMLSEADRTVERIRRGELDPFDSANRTIDFLREQNKASSTIVGARCCLLRFLRYSRLGLDPEDLAVSVKRPRRVHVLASKLPTREQVRGLLLVSSLKVKVLISMLVSTGARIGEVRRCQVSDVDFKRTPVHVHFRETKSGVSRIGFLSSETVELLRHYLRVRKHQHAYIFDGLSNVKGGQAQPLDQPFSHSVAWSAVHKAFVRLQMDQRFDNVRHYYHPHVFRTLSLALLKSGGYPADWAEYLIGHDIGTQTAYVPTIEVLANEWLKLDRRFCFLTDSSEIVAPEKIPLSDPTGIVEAHRILEKRHGSSIDQRDNALPSKEAFASHRWSSSSWLYVKARVDSVDYDEALAEGYAIYDSDGGVRVLRKRWLHPKS